MTAFAYNVPIIYTPQSDETFINKRVYLFKECVNTLPTNDLCGTWNFNHCPQDDNYCNPFKVGDKVYMQFLNDSDLYNNIIPIIIDTATGLPVFVPGLITQQTGQDSFGTTFLNFIIDTAAPGFTSKCWYMLLNLYSCFDINPAILQLCIDTKVGEGQSLEEATYNCWNQLCGTDNITAAASEPYCSVDNLCAETTILIEGLYTKYDCNGNYYGPFSGGGANSYKPQTRVYGEVYQNKFTFQETLVNRIRTKVRQIRNFTLLTQKIPPYVVEKIAVCFNSKKLTIDGVQFKSGLEIAKNNEDGQMWIIKTDLTEECSELDFNCE